MSARAEIPPAIQLLIGAGHAAPSADNSQPWQFCWDGKHLTVSYDTARVAGKTFGPGEHATLLAIGALKENILELACSLGIEIGELPVEKKQEYFRFTLSDSVKDVANAHEHPLFQRHTNRWPFEKRPIPRPILEPLRNMSQGECRALVFAEREMIIRIAGWVRIASEVRFQSQEVHEFLGRSLRFTVVEANKGDGLDVRTLALPPGGKMFLRIIKDWKRLAALNKLGFYKFLGMMEAQGIHFSSAILLIAGPDAGVAPMHAGMLMERVWVYLNSHGIAVHPYYVIVDQLQRLKTARITPDLRPSIETLESAIGTVLSARKDTIHMLLRIGYPKKQPIRSLRLPSEQVTFVGR